MPKIARQWATARIAWPIAGARIGTRMNTDIASDMMRAIARPAYWSRTSAIVTMRGPAAPTPWRNRPSSITSSPCARIDSTQPTTKIAKPT